MLWGCCVVCWGPRCALAAGRDGAAVDRISDGPQRRGEGDAAAWGRPGRHPQREFERQRRSAGAPGENTCTEAPKLNSAWSVTELGFLPTSTCCLVGKQRKVTNPLKLSKCCSVSLRKKAVLWLGHTCPPPHPPAGFGINCGMGDVRAWAWGFPWGDVPGSYMYSCHCTSCWHWAAVQLAEYGGGVSVVRCPAVLQAEPASPASPSYRLLLHIPCWPPLNPVSVA